MSAYSVTFRGKDGRQESVIIEAADRDAVFDELSRRGISAIRVEDAKGKSVRRAARSGGKPSVAGRALAWGIVGLLVAAGAYFASRYLAPEAFSPAKAERPAKAVNAAPETQAPIESPDVAAQTPAANSQSKRLADALAGVAAAESALTIRQPPKVNVPPGYTNRTFKTGVEQLMSWVFTVEVGDMPMPIPPISEDDRQQLAVILVSKNEIKDDDSDMTAFSKEQVDFAKEEMRDFIKQGGDPDDFLQYYFDQLRHAFEFRNEAQQQYYDLLEDDPDLAAEFAREVNRSFDVKGIKHIFTETDENEEEQAQ